MVRLESAVASCSYTDGISEREVEGGGTFGVDGVYRAIREAPAATAAATAMAIQRAVTSCWAEPWRTTRRSSSSPSTSGPAYCSPICGSPRVFEAVRDPDALPPRTAPPL